jgi:SSS family solute:Na+ symporter
VTPLLALLVGYCAGLVALGVWVTRQVHKAGDFFVGGRSLGAWSIFVTFLAANIGGSATIGATGLAYREGLAAWWWSGSAGLGSLVLAFFVGPRIWREASRLKLLTVGDFLEHHYDRTTRGVAAVIIWLSSLWILAGQFLAVSVVLNQAGGLAKPFGCLVAAVVMTAYFSGGGLRAAVAVNRVQLIVKLSGFAVAAPLAVAGAHGLQTLLRVNAGHLQFWRGPTYEAGWPLLFLVGPAFVVSPALLQKAFGARDTSALTRGIATNGLFLMLFAAAPIALGMTARVLYPHLTYAESQQALPLVLAGGVSLAVGGLALAAVLSAEMSAADAVLFMLSTSVARDCYRGVFRPHASDAQVLRVARIAAVASGALGYALTFSNDSVLDALKTFYAIMGVSLFAPIMGALYLRRVHAAAALGSMAAGVAALLLTPHVAIGKLPGWMGPNLAGLVASAAVFLALSGRRARRQP